VNPSQDLAREADPDVLEAVLSELGPLTPHEIAAGLEWSIARVQGAADRLEARLASAGPRVLIYDGGVLAIDTDLRAVGDEALDRLRTRHSQPLGAIDAQQLLELVRSHITDPAARPGAQRLSGGAALIERGLARASYDADRFPADGRLVAHPDVLYALGLIPEPAPAGYELEARLPRSEDRAN